MNYREPIPPKKLWKALFIGTNPLIQSELVPLLRRSLASLSCSEITGTASSSELAVALRAQSPDLCFVDLSRESDLSLTEVLPKLLGLSPHLVVVAVLSGTDPKLILRCLRQGATDFLLNPFTAEQVETMVQNVLKWIPEAEQTARPAIVYSVIPAKGACGASTIACNLAYQWRRLGANRILLIDLDPLTGTIAFMLKVKSQYSFIDVLNRSSELDDDLWKAMVVNRNGVDVLLAPQQMTTDAEELTDAGPIIEYARLRYDVVILDAPRVYGSWNLTQARLADDILLVTTNELIALQAARRALNYLENNGVGRWKSQLVVNRYERQAGLGEDTLATALNAAVYHLLPNDSEGVQKALMEGKAILPSTALGKGLARLADRLAGREDGARRSSSLGGLLSLFSRTSPEANSRSPR